MKSFKLLFTTLLVLCSATMVQAQLSNVTYGVRVAQIQSFDNNCAGANSWTSRVLISDNVNGAEGWSWNTPNATGDPIYGGGSSAYTRTNGSSVLRSRIQAWEDNTGSRTSYDPTWTFNPTPDRCYTLTATTDDVNFRNSAAPSLGAYVNTGTRGQFGYHTYILAYTWRYAAGGATLNPTFSCDDGASAPTTAYSGGQIPSWTVNLTAGRTYRFISSTAVQIRIYSTNGFSLNTSVANGTSGLTYTAPATGAYFIELTGGAGRTLVGAGGSLRFFEKNNDVAGSGTIAGNTTMSGVYNFTGDFVVNSGVTVTQGACPIIVNANNITINGTINADGRGNAGGNGGGGGGSSGGAGGGANATGGGGGAAGFGPGGGNGGTTGGNATGGQSIDCGSACVSGRDASRSGAAGGSGGSGGSYGGVGGQGAFSASGRTSGIGSTGTPGSWRNGPGGKAAYGTAANTSNLAVGSGGGGGGGGGGGFFGGGGAGGGGTGGGAVNLNASGNLSVGGLISANGTAGAAGGNGGVRSGGQNWNCDNCSNGCGGGANSCRNADNCGLCCYYTWAGPGGGGGGAGGGSGGGIKLQALGNMNVSGTVRANGGNGGNAGRPWTNIDGGCNGVASGGGSGSGGVVKYVYNPCAANNFGGSVQVSRGTPGVAGNGGGSSNFGQNGTFHGASSNIFHPSYNPAIVSISISGAATVCQGGSRTLTANLSGGQSTPANFQWYRNGTPVGANSATYATDASLAAGNYTYTVRSCAVTSAGVAVNVVADPVVTISGAADACVGGSATLSASVTGGTGTVASYSWTRNAATVASGNPYTTSNTLAAGSYSYNVLVTQTGSGCAATASAVSANVIPDPTVVINGAADVCEGGTVNLTTNVTGGLTAPTYTWTRNGTGVGSASSLATSSALSAGNYNYTVSIAAGNGCNATSAAVAANVVADPVITISGAGNVCQGGSVTLTAGVTGGLGSVTGYNWTRNGLGVGSSSSLTTANTLTPGLYTYVASATQSVSGCAGTSASVTTEVYEIPTATFTSTNVTCIGGNDGTITMTPSGGTGPYQYSIGGVSYQTSNVFSGLPVGTYSLYVKDANDCSRNVGSVTLIQEDLIPPTALCITNPLLVQLDSLGNGSISVANIDNGSFDNCSIASSVLSNTTYGCVNVGSHVVTLTVTDPDGNSASCTATVNVQDVTAPVAICQNAFVELDLVGAASIVVSDINNGSNDACGIASITVSPSTFNCGNAGQAVPVTLTVTDVNGNVSTCGATVTVEDVDIPGEAPRVSCAPAIAVSLDNNGLASINAGMVDGGSYDNCGLSLSLDLSVFNCFDVASPVTVTMTGTDPAGNTATCTTQVTVIDDLAPEAICPDVFTELDYDGYAYLSAFDMGFLSTDNCGIANITATQEEFFCVNLGYNEVGLTFVDVNGNISDCIVPVWVEDYQAPELYCQDIEILLDADGYALLTFDMIDAGSYDNCGIVEFYFTQNEFGCGDIGDPVYVYVEGYDEYFNAGFCEVYITVSDYIAPDAICQDMTIQLDEFGNAGIVSEDLDGGSTDACGVASVEASQLTFDCSHVGDNIVMLTVTDVNGNVATCDATVTVEDVTAPVIVSCQADVSVFNDPTVCGAALIFDLVVAEDACGIATIVNDFNGTSDASDFYPVGTTVVEFTVTDSNGNASNCSFTVVVEDNEPPVITACPADKFRPAAAGRCWALVTIEPLLATDNCEIESIVNSKNGTSNASGQYDLGITQVDWTVTDIYGNVSTCETYILVIDDQPPVALCQNITVELSSAGLAPITADDIDAGSTDNCTIIARNLSTNLLTCANVGVTPVTMTVIDNSGNTASCVSQVTVVDNVAPVAQCQDIVVFLNNDGEKVVAASQVNNGSTDACGIAALSLNNDTFTCTDLGDNAVVLTVTDVNGNSSTCGAIITVLDITNPVAVCNDLTVALDENGAASVTPEELSSASTDNCDIVTRFVNPNTFTCEDLGNNSVTVILIDQSGNTAFCFPIVEVIDVIQPDITCPADIAVNTDLGVCGATVSFDPATATDNCTVVSVEQISGVLNGDVFPVGINTVEYKAIDQSGNETVCSFIVAVTDAEAPEAICQDVIVELDALGNGSTTAELVDNGSNDACGIASLVLSQTAFNCSMVTDSVNSVFNSVTLTVTDNNGNVSTCIAAVIVVDSIAPVAICQDLTVQLDASGDGSITPEQVDNGSNDACGVASLNLSHTDFNCENVDANNIVLLSVVDVNGNVGNCLATITVEDNVAPVAICEDVTVQLDATGNGSTTAVAVGGYSNDACDIASLVLSQTAFICSEVGGNPVTVTVTDNNGNVSTCDATVTVEDNVAPVAICQNVTVQLDATGNGSTTATAVDNGSNDACGIASLVLSQTAFDCSEVGGNAVTLTVTDVNGNVSTCGATVTVEDNVAPVALCQDLVLSLDPFGSLTVTPMQFDNGSNDACGIANLAISQDAFDCSHVGDNTVTLTVTDVNGNVSTCVSNITVQDITSPIAVCKDVSVFLNDDGDAILDPLAVNNNSMDACGILPQCPPGSPAGSCLPGYSLDITYFSCSEVGNNTVTLTVTDVNLNSSSCTATVAVFDQVNPIALCQDVTVQLDASGNGSTTAVAVDFGSNDACGIASLVLSQTAFVCAEVGPNTETLTVTDVNGNVSTCDAVVTVEDNVAPVALCQDVAITLALGTASITPEDVDNGSNDACGIASLSVSEDTWNCTDIGLHVVTLTVTDVNGNVSTCDATIDVQGTIPEVSIASSLLPDFCQGGQVILTATSNEPVSFAWSPGAEPTAAIDVFATGTYSVVVTNVNGCTAGTSFYVNYNASGLASAYTIIAYDEVHLHGKGVVIGSGGVGVTAPSGEAKAHENTIVTAPTTFIAAPEIDVTGTSVVANQIIGTPNIPLPVFIENPYANNQGLNVNVPNNGFVTLSDAVYKNISIGKNAIVTFTQPNIYIQDIKVKDGSRVAFSGCANMIIKKKIDFEKNSKFNLEQNGVTLYVGESDKSSSKKVVEFDEGVVFYGRVFAVNGEIKSHKGTATNPTQLFGQFIGREVHFKDYTTVNWNTNCDLACSPTPPPACACTGGISKLTVEYSQWDAASPAIGTLRFYSDAGLTNNFATYTNVQPGNIYNVVASSLPGGIFGANLYATLDQNTEVIVIPTACGGDIVGEFFRELFIYSQTDNTGFICSSSQACGPGKTLMCHSPKNKKTPHTHCVKNKDVDKKANKYDWEIGPCPTPEFTARVTETEEDASVVLDGRNNTLVEDRINATVVELDAAPNPFKQSTMIRFRVPQDDQVRLVVFGVTGQEIERLYEGAVEGGREYRFDFQAGNIASGMYFYRLETGDGKVHVKKLIISK